MSAIPWYSAAAVAAPSGGCGAGANEFYFEGPEKKLEVFFSAAVTGGSFRGFPQSVWSDVLANAHCSILHAVGNEAFDAYLLSESSLFVYPHKLVLKTCGTTTLLAVLPRLLTLADELGCVLAHVHYSHFRYAQPALQLAPYTSFAEEQAAVGKLLAGHIGDVSAVVLGERHGGAADNATRWYALAADGTVPSPLSPPESPPPPDEEGGLATRGAGKAMAVKMSDEPDVFEVAMEGLAPSVCRAFFCGTHAPLEGRELAVAMSRAAGIAALVPHATIDDWAFEPCGYSMNALSGAFYYTVHVTPEPAFSYASFETNDPAYAAPEALAAILRAFNPTTCTVTLTARGGAGKQAVHAPRDVYATVADWQTTRLSPMVAVSAASYALHVGHGVGEGVEVGAGAPSTEGVTDTSLVEDAALSSADSESTTALDEANDRLEL